MMEIGAKPASGALKPSEMSPAPALLQLRQSIPNIEAMRSDPQFSSIFREMLMKFAYAHARKSTDVKPTDKKVQQTKPQTPVKKASSDPPTPAPSPESPRQRKKKPEFKHCVSHGVRHSYVPYIRDISTPDWAGNADVGEGQKIDGFDVVQSHKNMEIYESRILCGYFPSYAHPILARKALMEDGGLVMTQYEYEKTQRYETQNVKERVPGFWPERPWDTPDVKMSPEETEVLAKRLRDEEEMLLPDQRMRDQYSPKRSQSGTPKQKKPKSTLIKVTPVRYMTDDSDCTDIDDF